MRIACALAEGFPFCRNLPVHSDASCFSLHPSPHSFGRVPTRKGHRTLKPLDGKRFCHLLCRCWVQSLCSTHLCPQGMWQCCWHSWKDEKFQAAERAALTPLSFPRQLSCRHSSPLEVMSCLAPQCKSQKVSCLRKTINKKYQDYCLPHLQISPAHIFLSDNLCLPVSSCSNTSSFPKMDWSSWRLLSHLFKQTNLKTLCSKPHNSSSRGKSAYFYIFI